VCVYIKVTHITWRHCYCDVTSGIQEPCCVDTPAWMHRCRAPRASCQMTLTQSIASRLCEFVLTFKFYYL